MVGCEKKDGDSLAREKVFEGMLIELKIKCDCLFMDWVDKYIAEMKDQGCTRLACIGKELFDMHILGERPHELPILKKVLDLKKAPWYFLSIIIVYLSIVF